MYAHLNVFYVPLLKCSISMQRRELEMAYHLLVQVSTIQWSHHQAERNKTCLQALKKILYVYIQYIQATDVIQIFQDAWNTPRATPQMKCNTLQVI